MRGTRLTPIWLLGAFLFAGPERVLAQDDPCTLLPDPGPCEAAIPAWYFDQEFGACTPFSWGGCAGTVPFETLEDCLAADCTSGAGLSGLCDSISIDVQLVGDGEVGRIEILVDPDYTTPYWFGYAGFALFDMEDNLLAAEDVSTAPNAFGFDGMVEPHVRFLEYQNGVDLSTLSAPFELELRLYEGWMAGQVTERCQWLWTSFGETNDIPEMHPDAASARGKMYDLLGRAATPAPGVLLIERRPDGQVKKVVITE
ncbi:MAG: BPTI/Kunitz domain-containing protein [Flavobacteriales bacterium]|nr:BPTI/Kunitz domain-containing protein [Flavobacteriales bacterium]